MKNTAILLVDCSDHKGIVGAISYFLFRYNANILYADQHRDEVCIPRRDQFGGFDPEMARLGEGCIVARGALTHRAPYPSVCEEDGRL